ncbi:MAG: TonB-dependent receptor plug domain-containing protein, partial [Acidobacteriaceae bacterium]
MRKIGFLKIALCAFLICCSLPLLASDLKIKVVDPDRRPVAGARVVIYVSGTDEKPIAETQTSAEGSAELRGLLFSAVRVQVVAPGFAPAMQDADASGTTEIQLKIVAAPETVVVTAAGIPLVADQTGTQTATLDAQQLTNMQPVALSDAIRFLPGAIVSTAGQRGGQASLFVRGGDSRYNKFIIDGVPVDDPGGTFDLGVVQMQQVDRVEFTRGPESALYGTDAMTSTVQLFSAAGATRTPELKFGADAGNFATAHGYASVAGAY